MKLLEDIDELLAYLEDTAHGEEGKRITEMRHRIHTKLSNSHKPVVMQGCQCKDRIGETTVWCCNQCGLPCEDGWLPTHKAIRQPTVASEGLGEANTSAGFCSCATPNDCKDLTNCALYNRKRG